MLPSGAHDPGRRSSDDFGADPLELQRDWARSETYEFTTGIAKKLVAATASA